ncbi:Sorbitol dehydrogenase [Neofusicoccum parvum]|uniref:Sorbitol dehydrogenase n=2 Tax=Neofusicoccum parvum TaxID=310453 RepID=A0ACB5S8N9_9PEZI|nr:putative sorbitol dehydrogenase protein [Neofusicoccum parvum UCRNP2]GME29095.1 Sorbitol dehydrogenase [Neofusicoccum parvum]GME50364.1 Sorbitol dehydrogenase [Neofusicoccum parvum]
MCGPIRASVLHGAKDLRVENRELTAPAANELQVAVRATGLCGSDLHYYNHYRNGDIIVQEPMSLGHESAGVVVAVGSDAAANFKVGDKVALEVGQPCGDCERCKEGRYNICKGMKFRSSAKAFPHAQGTLQDRINHPAAWCHKLPEDLSLDLGALLEPLGVAIHATRRAQLPPLSTVLVFGAGAVGLLVAGMVKISGASNVVIADIDEGRVNFAVENGFAHAGFTVPLKRGQTIEENLEIARETAAAIGKVKKTTGEEVGEVDAVFECTGVPSCLQASIYATRPGGRVLLIGMGHPIQTLPISAAALREVDIVGVFRYANTYPTGIEVVSKPAGPDYPDFSKLVTHRYKGLDSIPEAFAMAGKTKDDQGKLVLKVVVEMDDNGSLSPRL